MDNPARILACDDSVTIRKALELILIPAGFEVEFAVNGAEAIEKAKHSRPSILLLDFILPDMRGTEVCRELLADDATGSIPVVLISARGAEIRQAYHDVENVIDYLTKPFTPDAVLGVIREVLASAPPAAEAATPTAEKPEARVDAPTAAAPPAPPTAPRSAPAVQAPRVEATKPVPPAANDGLEAMFETLRAGLEGVYVEELGSPANGDGDASGSYAELASRLAQQLGETLEQVEGKQRYRLYGDGSVRSLDESLVEAYRRVCRLLFRAVAAGDAGESVQRVRPRVLAVCQGNGAAFEQLSALAADPGEAHVVVVASDYRQLPILTRLYAPTHLVVDASPGGGLAEHLAAMRALPEGKRMKILALAAGAGNAARAADVGGDEVLEVGPTLPEAIRRSISPAGSASSPPV